MLVHLVDCGGEEGRDPVVDYETINRELALYSPHLAEKPQIVVATKMDLTDAHERADTLAQYLAGKQIPLLRISAVTGEGLPAVLDGIVRTLDAAGPAQPLPPAPTLEVNSHRPRAIFAAWSLSGNWVKGLGIRRVSFWVQRIWRYAIS